jgi:hypothetical protein
MMKQAFTITNQDGSSRTVELTGRNAWTLVKLIDAGKRGCTALSDPAPRWSGYVHKLRHTYGLDIKTIHESHGGRFAGTHARYVLNSRVSPINTDEQAAA